jgi:phosphate uptake regulator
MFLKRGVIMKRKIVKLGRNTLMISLPSAYVKENRLSKGQELEVVQKSDELIISPRIIEESKEISVTYNSEETLSRRVFFMPYIRGCDKITVTYKDSSVIDFIEKNMFQLTGFEIIEQTNSSIILQRIAKEDAGNFDNVFERMYNIVITMATDFENALRTGNFENIRKVVKFESLVNRLDFYCRRILHKGLYHNKEMMLSMYYIVRSLEDISDIIGRCINSIPEKEYKKDKLVADIMKAAIDLLQMNRKILHTADIDPVKVVKKKEDDLLELIRKTKDSPFSRFIFALYPPIHHINEEAIYYR